MIPLMVQVRQFDHDRKEWKTHRIELDTDISLRTMLNDAAFVEGISPAFGEIEISIEKGRN